MKQMKRSRIPTPRCICAIRPNYSRSTVWEVLTCRIAQLIRSCMTNARLTGTAPVFCRHPYTCASSLRASATCVATCRRPPTTSTANSLRVIKKGIDSAPNARRISAKPCIKHWHPFGGSVWRMKNPKSMTTLCLVFIFQFGCTAPVVMNPANRIARIPGDHSDTRSGSSVHGFHKNLSTNTTQIRTTTLRKTSFALKNGMRREKP